MKKSLDPVNPDEFGRTGMDVKAVRLATEQSEKSKAFMRAVIGAGIGVVALTAAGVGGVVGYIMYDNHANDPVTMENWKISEQVKLQVAHEKLTVEQKMKADEAMAKAKEDAAIAAKKQQEDAVSAARREEETLKQKEIRDRVEAENAVRAARPGMLLEKMFNDTEMSQAVCYPSNIQLVTKFNMDNVPIEAKKDYEGRVTAGSGETDAAVAKKECLDNFSIEKFSAPRNLGPLPTGAHYEQLKVMWNLCRGGFTQEDMDVTGYKNGAMELEYQLYAKDYTFETVKEYTDYQACMLKALSSPQVMQPSAGPVATLR